MSIRKYTAFLKVVETGSITKAAKMMGHTQSGVTQLMHVLEEELGVSLFNRSRFGITLTKEGQLLLPKIQEIVDLDESLKKDAEALKGNLAKTIRIGAFTSAAVYWLPNIIKDYQAIDSSIRFEVFDCGYNEIEEALLNHKADFVFAPLPLNIKCRTIQLTTEPLLAIVPSTHPLASKDFCPISAFETENVLSLTPAVDRDAKSVYKKAGITPNIKFTVEDDYAQIAMVGEGLGISIVPRLMLTNNQNPNIKALPLKPPAHREIGLAFPPGEKVSGEIEQFTAFIQKWLR